MKHFMQLIVLAFLFYPVETRTFDIKNIVKSNKEKIAFIVCVSAIFYLNYAHQNKIMTRLDDISSKLLTPEHLNTLGTQLKTAEDAILADIDGVGEGLNTLGADLPGVVKGCVKEVLVKEKIKVIDGYPIPTPEFSPTITKQPGQPPITVSTKPNK